MNTPADSATFEKLIGHLVQAYHRRRKMRSFVGVFPSYASGEMLAKVESDARRARAALLAAHDVAVAAAAARGRAAALAEVDAAIEALAIGTDGDGELTLFEDYDGWNIAGQGGGGRSPTAAILSAALRADDEAPR